MTRAQDQSLGKTLTLPLGLANAGRMRFFRSLTYVCCGLIFAIILWSMVAKFREVAVAQGQIMPPNAVQKVHHLEGGIVDAVLVSEGERVEKGQPLVRLRPEGATSDLEQLRAHLVGLRLQQVRLDALINGKGPDFSGFGDAYPAMREEQRDYYARIRARDAEEREKLQYQLLQAKAELASNNEELAGLKRQVEIESEQVAMRQRSFNLGYTSRIAFLEALSRLGGLQTKLASTDSRTAQLTAKMQEAAQALERADAERIQKLAEERSKVMADIAEKENAIKKFEDRVARLEVRSPDRGIVQLLSQKSPGEVIKPGDLVAEIVAIEADMIAEVRLAVKDIGHVELGAPANLKVANYDPTGLDLATGRVIDISASTFETKEGQPYYRTRIKLDRAYVGPPERNWRLLPGMVVEADIITGAKSLFSYMMKPVYRSLGSAMQER
jgi:adhesin transport system membrane fusion protein